MRRLVLLIVLCSVAADAVYAQEEPAADSTSALVRIELSDGSVFIGTVVEENAREIVLRTQAGAAVTIPKSEIRRREAFAGRIEGGRVIRYDPNRTRLLFSPTARPLGRGHGYVAVYELVIPFVAVGITERVSLSGGTVLLPGAFGRVFYVAPKVTLVNGPRLAVALGGVGLGVFVEDEDATAGIGYGLVTYGGPERAITVGAGFAFAEGEIADGALVVVGGETQVSNSVKLLTENYVVPVETNVTTCPLQTPCTTTTETDYEVALSAGIRFFGEQLAVDFALWTSPELIGEESFPFFPWLGFAYNFGR